MENLPSFETAILIVAVGFVGACCGSLINVVIYRLPIMLERQWLNECLGYLREWLFELKIPLPQAPPSPYVKSEEKPLANDLDDLPITEESQPVLPSAQFPWINDERRRTMVDLLHRLEDDPSINPPTPFNLALPPSHCPFCQTSILWYHNIPIFTWLLLRGRAACCGAKISARYFWVEALATFMCLTAFWFFGATWLFLFTCIFLLMLLALSGIDWEKRLLPDQLTLPLLWIGLIFNALGGFVPLSQAVIGAVVGYGILWGLYMGHRLITGREGMGFGDFKLTAAFGAWLGWQAIPLILFIAAMIGLIGALFTLRVRGNPRQEPIPFGPALCLAAAITLFFGGGILNWLGI